MKTIFLATIIVSSVAYAKSPLEQLSSPNYYERIEARKIIEKDIIRFIPLLEEEYKVSKDLTFKKSCQSILYGFYKPFMNEDQPYIWSLPKRHRFFDMDDVALRYYRKAQDIHHKENGKVNENDYGQYEIMMLATNLYLIDHAKFLGKESALSLRKEMRELEDKFARNIPIAESMCCPYYYDKPPEAIEDMIK